MSFNGNEHWDLSMQELADGCATFSISEDGTEDPTNWRRRWDFIPSGTPGDASIFKNATAHSGTVTNRSTSIQATVSERSDDWLNQARRNRNTHTISGALTHDLVRPGDIFEIDFRSEGKEVTIVVEVDYIGEWYVFGGVSVSSIENGHEVVRLRAPSTTIPLPIYFSGKGQRNITKYYREYINWPVINESNIIGIVLHRERTPVSRNMRATATGVKGMVATAAVAALDQKIPRKS